MGGADRFHITESATRHERLKGIVGASFHCVSRTVAEHIARAQFREKTVGTNADEAEHLKEFADLWQWYESQWFETLPEAERNQFTSLVTDVERGPFRIIRSYARKAAQDGNADFPIARDNLSERIGLTGKGAGELRTRFMERGIMNPTVRYVPNVSAARFCWLLGEGAAQTPCDP